MFCSRVKVAFYFSLNNFQATMGRRISGICGMYGVKGKDIRDYWGNLKEERASRNTRNITNRKTNRMQPCVKGLTLAEFSITSERWTVTVTEILLGALSPFMKILIWTNYHNVSSEYYSSWSFTAVLLFYTTQTVYWKVINQLSGLFNLQCNT